MRVLLINSNRRGDILAAAPIGLCYVASATEAAGHEVRVLDLCFSGQPARLVERAVTRFLPQVVGVSIRNLDNVNLLHPVSYLPELVPLTRQLRRLTSAPIVIGGSGASLAPRHLLQRMQADFVIVSDGESSFVELLGRLEKGASPDGIPGLGLMIDGRFRLAPPLLKDFAGASPRLDRWIDLQPYSRMGASYTIQSKRGCPLRCVYCTYNQVLEGNRLRLRPPLEVVDEMEEAVLRHKARGIEFVDSVFNLPRDHCVQVLEEIVRRPWRVSLTAMGISPRGMDKAFLDLMWRAGFRSFMISPESASAAMIENYGKGFGVDDVVRAAMAVKPTRFTVLWYFLIGGPGETNATLRETLDFTLRHLRLDRRPPYNVCHFYLGVRLYPGTRLWDRALRDGYITPGSDPLHQLWYLSEGLHLDRALRQMVAAARRCPEIVLGFDERHLPFSRFWAAIADRLPMARPYWRHAWGLNQMLIRSGLRYRCGVPHAAAAIRRRLRLQGYRGPLPHPPGETV